MLPVCYVLLYCLATKILIKKCLSMVQVRDVVTVVD